MSETNTYTEEQRNTIKSLVKQINEIAEKQQALAAGTDDFGTIVADTEPILLHFADHEDPPYVVLYDGFAQSDLDVIERPLTQLPAILLLVKENIDIVDAVSLIKVRAALRLLEHLTLNKEEARILEDGLTNLQYIKRTLVGRCKPTKAAIDPTFGGIAECVECERPIIAHYEGKKQ